MRSNKIKTLEKVRDMFVLSCNLGQRYSDMVRISPENFRNGIFSIVQQKTGNKCYVPINSLSIDSRITFAILNYTYGTNGMPVNPPCIVNLIDTAQILIDINKARAKKADVIRMYLPPDANCLLSCFDHCIKSKNYVNVTSEWDVGGVVAVATAGSITNCENHASVNGKTNVGGVVGYIKTEKSTVSTCENHGQVLTEAAKGRVSAGGIVGFIDGSDATVTACDNTAEVKNTAAA